MEDYLPLTAIAKRLGCDPSLLRKRCIDGTLPSIRLGNEHRVLWSDVLAWASSRPASPRLKCQEIVDDVTTIVDAWLSYLIHVKALSPATLTNYRTFLMSYLKRAAGLGDTTLTLAVLYDRKTVMAVFSRIPAKSFNVKNNTYIALRSLGQFLIQEGKLTQQALDDLKPLKPRRQSEPRRTHLKPEDASRLFDVILTRPKSVRENLMMASMLGCMVYAGLRISERAFDS